MTTKTNLDWFYLDKEGRVGVPHIVVTMYYTEYWITACAL